MNLRNSRNSVKTVSCESYEEIVGKPRKNNARDLAGTVRPPKEAPGRGRWSFEGKADQSVSQFGRILRIPPIRCLGAGPPPIATKYERRARSRQLLRGPVPDATRRTEVFPGEARPGNLTDPSLL